MNVPCRFHQDDRGIRYCDVFPDIESGGDINITKVYPGTVALWHRHRKQADYQFVIKGSLKIGICNLPNFESFPKGWSAAKSQYINVKREQLLDDWQNIRSKSIKRDDKNNLESWPDSVGRVEWHYLSENSATNGALFIPTGLWHGCYNFTNEPAYLIYHITNKWDGTDEERMDVEVAGWEYEAKAK